MSEPLPDHGPCFVCGPHSPRGLGLTLERRPDLKVEARAVLGLDAQGPPGFAHGGCLAAILDEVMGAAAWVAGHRVMAAHLELDYRIPVPLGVEITFLGWVLPPAAGSRKVPTRGTAALPDGRVATEARGIFVHAPEALVGKIASQIGWADLLGKSPDR